MNSSKNTKTRVVVVLVPLFLGFVMPWALQANRGFRGEAQFKIDLSIMFASTIFEVVIAVVFVSMFVVSLLYFAKQPNSRRFLLTASVVSLAAFAVFCVTYSLLAHNGNAAGWIYYALAQMFPGVMVVVGYAAAAIVRPCCGE